MKKLLPVFILLLLTNEHVTAQHYTKRNMNWTFGNGAGLRFTSGSVDTFTSSMVGYEGSATLSDDLGNLLFYTNGMTVWNRAGNPMPYGPIVAGDLSSTTQAAVIAPVLNNPNQYYVFSLESRADPGNLVYCIVDMTLDGGMGNIIPSTVGTPITDSLSEKMIIVPGNHCNLWLLVHSRIAATIMAYEITNSGVNMTPVISTVGSGTSFLTGGFKISPNRQKLLMMNMSDLSYTATTELFDFDPNTGIVSNNVLINSRIGSYGGEFSPNGTMAYIITHSGPAKIYQYNVSLSTPAAIQASEFSFPTLVGGAGVGVSDLRLAPDNKIYLTTGDLGNTLTCINSPDNSGTSCNYAANAVNLGPHNSRLGFPNVYWSGWRSPASVAICPGATIDLSGTSPAGTWSSGNTAIATVGATSGIVTGVAHGSAVISYSTNGCGAPTTITSVITVLPDTAGTIMAKDTLCMTSAMGSMILSNNISGGEWSSSNTACATVTPTTGVFYGVSGGNTTVTYTLTNSCGTFTATKQIQVLTPAQCKALAASQVNASPEELRIFPNPAHGLFTVTMSSVINEEAHIEVFNVTGEKIKEITSITNRATEIKMDEAKGVFIVFVTTAHSRYCTKVLAE